MALSAYVIVPETAENWGMATSDLGYLPTARMTVSPCYTGTDPVILDGILFLRYRMAMQYISNLTGILIDISGQKFINGPIRPHVNSACLSVIM